MYTACHGVAWWVPTHKGHGKAHTVRRLWLVFYLPSVRFGPIESLRNGMQLTLFPTFLDSNDEIYRIDRARYPGKNMAVGLWEVAMKSWTPRHLLAQAQ